MNHRKRNIIIAAIIIAVLYLMKDGILAGFADGLAK